MFKNLILIFIYYSNKMYNVRLQSAVFLPILSLAKFSLFVINHPLDLFAIHWDNNYPYWTNCSSCNCLVILTRFIEVKLYNQLKRKTSITPIRWMDLTNNQHKTADHNIVLFALSTWRYNELYAQAFANNIFESPLLYINNWRAFFNAECICFEGI